MDSTVQCVEDPCTDVLEALNLALEEASELVPQPTGNALGKTTYGSDRILDRVPDPGADVLESPDLKLEEVNVLVDHPACETPDRASERMEAVADLAPDPASEVADRSGSTLGTSHDAVNDRLAKLHCQLGWRCNTEEVLDCRPSCLERHEEDVDQA